MPRKTQVYATRKDVSVPQEVLDRREKVEKKLAEAYDAIGKGQVPASEPPERRASHQAREIRKFRTEGGTPHRFAMPSAVVTTERIIHNNEILPLNFLDRGLIAARSVGCILRMWQRCATGFLVAPHILLTNNHVLAAENIAALAQVEFEIPDPNGHRAEIRRVTLDPDRFWFTDPRLDVTFVGLIDTAETAQATADLGWHPMIAELGKILIGDPINIIQHPGGRPKALVVHNSNLLHLEHDPAHADLLPYAWYNSDTEPGSSGSPVFNRHWEVVAVHHSGVPLTNDAMELLDREGNRILKADYEANPGLAVWIANEGSRTSQIVAALEKAAFDKADHARVRDELLALWEASRTRNQGQTVIRAAPAAHGYLDAPPARPFTEAIIPGQSRPGGVTIQISGLPEGR